MVLVRVLSILAAAVLSCVVSSVDGELSAKALALEDLRVKAGGGLIPLDSKSFKKFVEPKTKDYDIFVYMTATGATYKCDICQEAGDHFQLVIENYYYADGLPMSKERPLFFVTLDYGPPTQMTFQKLGVNNVPIVWFYGPNGTPGLTDKYDDVFRKGVSHEYFKRLIQEKTGVDFRVRIPINWPNVIIMTTFYATVALGLYFFFPIQFAKDYAHYLLCAICMASCLLFTSGYMWNVIRGAGAYSRGRDGQPTIWGPPGQQTMSESYVVMFCNGVAALGFVCLMMSPKIKWITPNITSIIFLIFAAGLISTEIFLFKSHKNSGYPFRLFF
eukprot:CFRG4230T1